MIKLYLTRTGEHNKIGGHRAMERLIEISHWVEKQFGKPDYIRNYDLDFADWTDDWAMFRFHNHTQAFWTYERFKDDFLTEDEWQNLNYR